MRSGDKVDLRYNPKDPNDIFSPEIVGITAISTIIGIGFICIGKNAAKNHFDTET